MMYLKGLCLLMCFSLLLCSCAPSTTPSSYPPKGFVYVEDIIPGLKYDIRYFGTENFMGKPVPGYNCPKAILTQEAAYALLRVQKELDSLGYSLKIYDAYRPQKAVDAFVSWAKDEADTLQKAHFYPEVAKKDLIPLQYIAAKSGHTRGSTVDLTLIRQEDGKELDMGSSYDYFGPISHHGTNLITPVQEANRNLLRDVMLRNGFQLYPEEWWHYTLQDEPYPDTYFEFEIHCGETRL